MKTVILLALVLFLTAFGLHSDFLSEQKKYERVKTAYDERGCLVSEKLANENIRDNQLNILLKAYKAERQLELYAKNNSDASYKKIRAYTICASSGEAGPKRKQGDYQVPEGFYHIDRFNPVSNFYLSLGINYPNQSDRLRSSAKNLGGDIFIHGACASAGCLAMTDNIIKEIYLYAVQARHNGQLQIPVYIFPFRMTDANMKKYAAEFKENETLLTFWENLKTGYDKFKTTRKELNVKVDKQGNYTF